MWDPGVVASSCETAKRAWRMSGAPIGESGHELPLASWYRLEPPIQGGIEFMIITSSGGYQCDALGHMLDWGRCLVTRCVDHLPEDALERIGYGVVT